jgi:hypothetical protein
LQRVENRFDIRLEISENEMARDVGERAVDVGFDKMKTSRAFGVNILTRRLRSRKIVPMSVELSRFRKSDVRLRKLFDFDFNSSLTVIKALR